MQNLKNILALLVLSLALYSCDAEVTMDNPQAEAIETLAEDGPGDQDNDVDDRDDDSKPK